MDVIDDETDIIDVFVKNPSLETLKPIIAFIFRISDGDTSAEDIYSLYGQLCKNISIAEIEAVLGELRGEA